MRFWSTVIMRICLNKFLIFFEPYDDEVILRTLNRYPRAVISDG